MQEHTAPGMQPEREEDTIDLLELFMGLLAHWQLIAAADRGNCSGRSRSGSALHVFSGDPDVQGNSYDLCGQPQ